MWSRSIGEAEGGLVVVHAPRTLARTLDTLRPGRFVARTLLIALEGVLAPVAAGISRVTAGVIVDAIDAHSVSVNCLPSQISRRRERRVGS